MWQPIGQCVSQWRVHPATWSTVAISKAIIINTLKISHQWNTHIKQMPTVACKPLHPIHFMRFSIRRGDAVMDLLEEFDRAKCEDATFKYWRTYMHLVSVLLRFTRAIRGGNWLLYLSSFAEMLPWFAAYDHVNYFRWGVIFLADMKLLHKTAPDGNIKPI